MIVIGKECILDTVTEEIDPCRIYEIGYFKLAKEISYQSDHRVKVGAVIVNPKPISIASNINKTHPVHANPYVSIRGSLHAECRAVIRCNSNLNGSTIYVYRELKNGLPGLARPCNYCLTILKEYGIRVIYYSTSTYPYWKMERI
jgi:pyrimidine deaminase RibD-like protein